MSLWMVIRVNGDEWSVVEVIDTFYNIDPAGVYDWSVSFSYRMVLGLGPKVAPRCWEVPAYVNAPCYSMARIASYIAIPLELPNGQLFGVLTGIDPQPRTDDLHNVLPELEIHGKSLMQLLTLETQVAKLESKVMHLESPNWQDKESGALSIDAWQCDSVEAERARVNYLEAAGIIYIELPEDSTINFSNVVNRLENFSEDRGVVYRENERSFFVMLRDLTKPEQQTIFKDARKYFEHRYPGTKCIHVYREPKSTTFGVLEDAKKGLRSRRSRKAA